jgi:hypothetical protein
VRDDLLEHTTALAPYLQHSYEDALTLKPKPTKRRQPRQR